MPLAATSRSNSFRTHAVNPGEQTMADLGLSYRAWTEPSPIGVNFSLSMSHTILRATIRDIDSFILRLEPSGNVSEEILSGIAWPVAQTMAAAAPSLLKDSLLKGKTFDAFTLSATTLTVEGEHVMVTPGNLSVSNFNGMLMVQGTLNVSGVPAGSHSLAG